MFFFKINFYFYNIKNSIWNLWNTRFFILFFTCRSKDTNFNWHWLHNVIFVIHDFHCYTLELKISFIFSMRRVMATHARTWRVVVLNIKSNKFLHLDKIFVSIITISITANNLSHNIFLMKKNIIKSIDKNTLFVKLF